MPDMPTFTTRSEQMSPAKERAPTALQSPEPKQTPLLSMKSIFGDVSTYHYGRSPAQRRVMGASGTRNSDAIRDAEAGTSGSYKTGLPPKLRSGMEALSGLSLDDVKVHYNSPKPAGMNALAYAQGENIHLAPGREQDLPHEAWHLVQQRQGRVKATTQMAGVGINDDTGLEREADVMGARAITGTFQGHVNNEGAPIYADVAKNSVLQCRRILHVGDGYVAGIDTENLTMDELEGWLASGQLSPSNQLEVMRAIDAGEVKGGYPGAYEYAEKHLGFISEALPTFGKENEFSWLRRITGGGSGSLTGKRDAKGIKTDMSDQEYEATRELTKGFYTTAATLNERVPREEFLTLFRGFTIPVIEGEHANEELEEKISNFSDVLPSSSSWQREKAIEMSNPGEGESSVLVYMSISPELPVVMMSYPSNMSPEGKPKPIDIGQAEVLVAASNYEGVNVFRIERLKNGRLRYHVEVTLVARDPEAILEGVEIARAEAASNRAPKGESKTIETSELDAFFGKDVGKVLAEKPVLNSIYTDVNGKRWI